MKKQKELERLFGALKPDEELRKYRLQLEERAEELKSINRRLEREIAERKQAEISLRESEERYRNLFENSSLGIFQTNINGTFITLNESCARIFGYNSPDEVMRQVRDIKETVYPETSLRDEMIETLRMTQGMRKFEYNLLRKDGSPLTVNLYIRLVRDVKGKELYLEGFLEDITERKSKDEALRKIHFQQKAMLDNIPHIAWLKDTESRFIAVNASFLKAFNLEADEVEGKTDFDICPAELAEKYREDDRQVMISKKQFQVIEPLANKEGNIIWLDTIKTPIFNDTGDVIGTTGIARDISERKIAEDKLRSANQQLLDIIEFLPDATFVIDKCSRVIAWNRAIEDMTGVKKEDIIGKSDYAYSVPFYGHRRPMLLDLIEKPDIDITDKYEYIEKKGKILYGERFFPFMFDGRGAYLWVTASPLFDLNGNLAGAIESIRDITERKRLDEAIKASEKNFRRLSEEYHILLDALPDTLLVLSYEMEILWVNTSAVFHLDEDTVLKRKCYGLFYNETKPCKNCPVVKSFSTGRAESAQVLTSNNRYLDVRSRPIKDEYGHISKIIVLARDMTEKIFLQREAMRTTHLASIGELAAGVAHEINNPLTGIINYAQIIANKSEKNSKNYDVCKRIIKEGDRIARIVKSLLSFARSTRQDKMPVDIGQIFTDSIILTGARMNKDGITFQINISETLPKIIAEPNQIQQVFLNILSNARYALNNKYSSYDSNKIINVACEEITVDNEKFVRIMFHDNGCGVHSGIIDKVFNPFFTTKPLGEGTGLGLSISYGIINEHKGHIMIDSVEGEFTKVIIDLPVWEGESGE